MLRPANSVAIHAIRKPDSMLSNQDHKGGIDCGTQLHWLRNEVRDRSQSGVEEQGNLPSGRHDAGYTERLGRHRAVEVPGDRDRPLSAVFDIGGLAETQERCGAQIVRW